VRLSGSHELALATPIFSAPGARPEGGALTPPSMPSVSLHGAFSPPSAAPMPAPPGVSRTALLTTAGVSFAVALAVGVVVLYARSPGPSHAAPAGSAASPEATVAPSAAAAPTTDVSIAPAPSAPVASAAETASPPSAASAVPTTAPRPAQAAKTGAPPPVAPPIPPNSSPSKKKKAEWGY
jgi:pilus assembly protein FimV